MPRRAGPVQTETEAEARRSLPQMAPFCGFSVTQTRFFPLGSFFFSFFFPKRAPLRRTGNKAKRLRVTEGTFIHQRAVKHCINQPELFYYLIIKSKQRAMQVIKYL